MRVRVTREWVFEVQDGVDRKKLDDQVYWFFQGAQLDDEIDWKEVDSSASWCILTPEGLPLAPSQYPKRDPA